MNGNAKVYYSISEVCARTGLEPHVLRYWESEFSQLRPKKNRAGNRAYREKDIKVVEYIRHLLYEEKYTIPGAKKKLTDGRESHEDRNQQPESRLETPQLKLELSVDTLKSELGEVLRLLQS